MSSTVTFDFHASPAQLREALETVRVLSSELLVSPTLHMEALNIQRHRYRVVVAEGSVDVETYIAAIEQALGRLVSITSVQVQG